MVATSTAVDQVLNTPELLEAIPEFATTYTILQGRGVQKFWRGLIDDARKGGHIRKKLFLTALPYTRTIQWSADDPDPDEVVYKWEGKLRYYQPGELVQLAWGEVHIVTVHPVLLRLRPDFIAAASFSDLEIEVHFPTLLSIAKSPYKHAFLTQPPVTSILLDPGLVLRGSLQMPMVDIDKTEGVTSAHVLNEIKKYLRLFKAKLAYDLKLSQQAIDTLFPWNEKGLKLLWDLAKLQGLDIVAYKSLSDTSELVAALGGGPQQGMYAGVTLPLDQYRQWDAFASVFTMPS